MKYIIYLIVVLAVLSLFGIVSGDKVISVAMTALTGILDLVKNILQAVVA